MRYAKMFVTSSTSTTGSTLTRQKKLEAATEKAKKSIKPSETFLKNFSWRTVDEWGNKSGTISASVIYKRIKIAVVSYTVSWTQVGMLGNCGLKGIKHISTSLSVVKSITNEQYKISRVDVYCTYFRKEMSKKKISDQMIESFFKGYMLKQHYSIAFTDRVNRGAKQYTRNALSVPLGAGKFKTRRRTTGIPNGYGGVCTSSIIARLQTEAFGGVATFTAGWHNSQHPSLGELSITQFVIWVPPTTSCFTDMAHTVDEQEDCPYDKLGKKVSMYSKTGFSDYLHNELIVVDGTKAKKY